MNAATEMIRWHFYSGDKSWSMPPGWTRGQLLDVKRFTDGTFKLIRLGDEAENPESVKFDNTVDCQNFVGWWYASREAQANER